MRIKCEGCNRWIESVSMDPHNCPGVSEEEAASDIGCGLCGENYSRRAWPRSACAMGHCPALNAKPTIKQQIEQGMRWQVDDYHGPLRFILDQHNNVVAERINSEERARLIAAAPALYGALGYVSEVAESINTRQLDDSATVNITVTAGWLREAEEALALVSKPLKVGESNV